MILALLQLPSLGFMIFILAFKHAATVLFAEVNVTLYSSAEEAIWGGIRKIGKRLQANHSLSGWKQRNEPLVTGIQDLAIKMEPSCHDAVVM